ncbi:MAG: hypothetical protein IKN73_01500 [Alphaproteobacteria bacterium]|nr:hypothetical protein [Alphaproteobacteria bacterium]
MKDKVINIFILATLVMSVVCLRPLYGLHISADICFFIGSVVFFIKGYLNFCTGKHKSLSAYIGHLNHKLEDFIGKQAHNYKTKVWYKQPKYWLLIWFFGVVLLYMLRYWELRYSNYFIRHLLYIIPFLPFVIRGYAFPFVWLFFAVPVFGLLRIIRVFMSGWWHPELLPLISLIWVLLAEGFLIYVCYRIERTRKDKKYTWKQIVFDVILSLILFGFCVFMIMR